MDEEVEPLDEAFDALEFAQGGVDLFGEELPTPEPPCDIAANEGILLAELADEVVDGQVDEASAKEATMLDDDPDDPNDEPVPAVAGEDVAEEIEFKEIAEAEAVGDNSEPTFDGVAGAEIQTAAEAADRSGEQEPSGGSVVADDPGVSSEPSLGADETQAGIVAGDRAQEPGAAPLALYRRYRPDTFAEVIGQDHVTVPLMRAIANNKVNHAYLFSGPRGCGKTTSARILARCLNCEQGPTPTPCGVCDSCVALATGGPGSIDVIEIDAASHGRVDDARELRDGVYFAPVHSRFKIYIIDEAHMVTKEGFNALLKVVEEPPEHVKFIFATTEPDKVIGTIRSRTHHYPFRLVPPRVLGDYLAKICTEEGVQVEHAVLPLVVRAGAGSVRDCLSVLDQLLGAADHGKVTATAAAGLLGYTPDTLLDEIVDAFAAGDGAGVFATIDKVIETGQDPRRFAEDLLERMRDLVIVAQVPDAIETRLIDVPDDQAERLRTQAAGLGAGELTRAAEVIAAGLVQMRGTTAPRLHLELICSRILLPAADRDERGIHARLDRLERRLAVGGIPAGEGGGATTTQPASISQGEDSSRQLAQQPVAQRPVGQGSSGQGAGAIPAAQRQAQQRASQGQGRGGDSDSQRDGGVAPSTQRPAQQRPAGQPPAPRAARQVAAGPAAAPATQEQGPLAGAPQQPQPNNGWEPEQDWAAEQPANVARVPQSTSGSQGYSPVTGQTAPAVDSVPPTPTGAAPAGPGTADLRRLWPQILDEVKTRKRFTHALISQNAHVIEVRGRDLLLGFSSPGTMERFQDGGSGEILHDSILAVMGVDLQIHASVDGGPSREESRQTTRPTTFTAPPNPPAPAQNAAPNAAAGSHWSRSETGPGQGQQRQPQSNQAPAQQSSQIPGRQRPAGTPPARQSSQQPNQPSHIPAQQRPAGTPPAPHVEHTSHLRLPEHHSPEPEPVDPDLEVSPEDEIVDDASVDAAELLARELGAEIIEEDDLG